MTSARTGLRSTIIDMLDIKTKEAADLKAIQDLQGRLIAELDRVMASTERGTDVTKRAIEITEKARDALQRAQHK
jgi:hypothetical protein